LIDKGGNVQRAKEGQKVVSGEKKRRGTGGQKRTEDDVARVFRHLQKKKEGPGMKQKKQGQHTG